jgi:hypothetical protein
MHNGSVVQAETHPAGHNLGQSTAGSIQGCLGCLEGVALLLVLVDNEVCRNDGHSVRCRKRAFRVFVQFRSEDVRAVPLS